MKWADRRKNATQNWLIDLEKITPKIDWLIKFLLLLQFSTEIISNKFKCLSIFHLPLLFFFLFFWSCWHSSFTENFCFLNINVNVSPSNSIHNVPVNAPNILVSAPIKNVPFAADPHLLLASPINNFPAPIFYVSAPIHNVPNTSSFNAALPNK